MYAVADEDNLHDLQIAQVRFGSDVFLEPGSERFAEEIAEEGKGQGEGEEEKPPSGRFGSSKRHPGKGRREKRRGDEVGAAAGVDGKFAFAAVESGEGLRRRGFHVFGLKIAEQEEACGVGMPRHASIVVFAREDVEGGVFERMIAPCFEDEGKL